MATSAGKKNHVLLSEKVGQINREVLNNHERTIYNDWVLFISLLNALRLTSGAQHALLSYHLLRKICEGEPEQKTQTKEDTKITSIISPVLLSPIASYRTNRPKSEQKRNLQ